MQKLRQFDVLHTQGPAKLASWALLSLVLMAPLSLSAS